MFIQCALLITQCVLSNEVDVVHSALCTANLTALAFHFTTIAKITQNDFSFYHSAVTIQFIIISIIPFVCALNHLGSGRVRRSAKKLSLLNFAILCGELIYMKRTMSDAELTERSCITGKDPGSTHGLQSFLCPSARFYQGQDHWNWVLFCDLLSLSFLGPDYLQ